MKRLNFGFKWAIQEFASLGDKKFSYVKYYTRIDIFDTCHLRAPFLNCLQLNDNMCFTFLWSRLR